MHIFHLTFNNKMKYYRVTFIDFFSKNKIEKIQRYLTNIEPNNFLIKMKRMYYHNTNDYYMIHVFFMHKKDLFLFKLKFISWIASIAPIMFDSDLNKYKEIGATKYYNL